MNALVEQFMTVLSGQPLSLALCAMNLLLLYFLFKQGSSFIKQRKETADAIIEWQKEVQELMASCVSAENLKLILDALERDRELYRAQLAQMRPTVPLPPE